jgi:hypothetical protein
LRARQRPGSAIAQLLTGFPAFYPRQQLVETLIGCPVDHAREHVRRWAQGLDVVKLAHFDQRTKNGLSDGRPIAADEEIILATERHWPGSAFSRVGRVRCRLHAGSASGHPARECVADRFGNRAAACYERRLLFEHDPRRLHEGLGAIEASCEPTVRERRLQ